MEVRIQLVLGLLIPSLHTEVASGAPMWSLRSAFLQSCRFPWGVRLLHQPGDHPDIDRASAKMFSVFTEPRNYVPRTR